jgi:hypothetical protein
MKPFPIHRTPSRLQLFAVMVCSALAPAAFAQQVTFAPYIQLGDHGTFGPKDQIVIAWQTDENAPKKSAYKVAFKTSSERDCHYAAPDARIVDNYLAADPALPAVAGAYGAHSNYTAVLLDLKYDTVYDYVVTGPGMPKGGFASHFRTRKRGPVYSFVVEGDEGFFPTVPNSTTTVVDYEARIAHLVHDAAKIELPNEPKRPEPDFILNTGDNVYNEGTEDSYRDFFFPIYNSDKDSNETGAPILRSTLFFPTAGNHDLGSTGVSANLLADNAAPAFSGNESGGDALSYFIDFYFPQNGPKGFDIQQAWNVNTSAPTGFTFSYEGTNYTSPAAIKALRDSTKVDTGNGTKTQIDHQSNYSFDYGNAHILVLDANPHLFNDNLPGGNAYNTAPPLFTKYPPVLANWIVNDLDASKQLWKIVVYHQPAFSSGDATIVNNQMRSIAKLLEDHGVSFVFNGHEHNYQRTFPLLATDRTAGPVNTTAGTPAVKIDTTFDGVTKKVPDGVLYLVEGAAGNRDFDGDDAPPRGSGVGLDQDDSATGTFTDQPGLTVPQGPASWLDANLSSPEMVNFLPNAGQGQRITDKFKSKIFSFGHVLVDNNKLTLYQISEPLQATSSATIDEPAPFGTDINGKPLNDPIPDTEVDPATGEVVSAPATGTAALLDKWTVEKPDISSTATATLTGPEKIHPGDLLDYHLTIETSKYALSGTQVRFTVPSDVTFAGTKSDTVSLQGNEIVVSFGHLDVSTAKTIAIHLLVDADAHANHRIQSRAEVTSSTALPIVSNVMSTTIIH